MFNIGYSDLKSMKNFGDYVTIKKAAEILGVSPNTLRNWDAGDKLKSIRHPLNGYRLYSKSDLENLLKKMQSKDNE